MNDPIVVTMRKQRRTVSAKFNRAKAKGEQLRKRKLRRN
jgi:hypothetical protein